MEVPAPSVTLIRVTLRIYDTATRTLRDFEPVRAGHASVYLCGATVQTVPHIGHIRSGVAFDILRNWLEAHGLDVAFVRNVTNIDDKILTKAADNGRPWWEWAATHERAFQWAYDQLGVRPPSIEPRATGHITEMVEYMRRIIDNGHGYAADGNVYMQPTSLPDYGHLSGQKLDELDQGESAGTGKRDPRDFTMWKAAKPGEPSWPTPWGDGRPGWHIECTAMATKYLGAEFDIHCGGLDLQFPHHENEIAQAHAAGDPFARYWMHNGWVTMSGEKMSKSLGNFYTLKEVLDKYPADAVRLLMLQTHYRAPLDFSFERLEGTVGTLERMKTCVANLRWAFKQSSAQHELSDADCTLAEAINTAQSEFDAQMDDDFNTAGALAAIFALVTAANTYLAEVGQNVGASPVLRAADMLCELTGALGIDLTQVASTSDLPEELVTLAAQVAGYEGSSADEAAEALLAARQEARSQKNWAVADQIRDGIAELGLLIEDTAAGARLKRKAD